MTELSPRAKELMRRAARGGGPTEGQRRLLKRSVMAAVLLPTVASALTLKLVLAGFIVAAVGAGGTMALLRSQRRAAPAPVCIVAAAALPEPSPPPAAAGAQVPEGKIAVAAPAPEVWAEPALQRRVVSTSAPAAPMPAPPEQLPSVQEAGTAGLSREMESLDRAVRALDAEHFDEGLAEAREFLRAFPASEFAIEARVVEVLALCGLSRTDEARAAFAYLPRASGNPAVRRLQDACIWSEPQ